MTVLVDNVHAVGGPRSGAGQQEVLSALTDFLPPEAVKPRVLDYLRHCDDDLGLESSLTSSAGRAARIDRGSRSGGKTLNMTRYRSDGFGSEAAPYMCFLKLRIPTPEVGHGAGLGPRVRTRLAGRVQK